MTERIFSSTPELAVDQNGPVLWLTITREERRNAMSHGVLAGMTRAINEAQSQRDIRAIVITGAGTKAFCAGADLQSAQAFTTDYSEPQGHLAQLLRAARSVLFVIEEVLPLPSAQEESITERFLNEYILKVEWVVEVSAIAVRRELHAVGPTWIKHMTKEIDAHAPQLKATFVLRTGLSLFSIQRTTSRIRI